MTTPRHTLDPALSWIAANPAARASVVRSLIEIERNMPYREGFNIRDEVTGPIVDRLFAHGEMVTKTLADGLMISCRYTSKIARDFVMAHRDPPDHVWEPQTTRLLPHLARGARHVVVGGAYFGDQSTPLAREVAPTGVVHCFELSPDNAEMLELNARQNDLANVRVSRTGLWSRETSLSLAGSDAYAAPLAAPGGRFAATTLDAYLDRQGIDRIDLVMLDIEGGELEALRGAAGQLGKSPGESPALVFEVHAAYVDWSGGLRSSCIVRFVESHGYCCYCVRDYNSNVSMVGRPIELIPADDVHLDGPPHGFNVVAVKRPELLDPEIFSFCRGVSPKLLFHRDPRLHAPLA